MDIINFLVILLTGFGGLFAHWYNRYVQGRTSTTFLQYLQEYRQRTISSCLTILASEIALFQSAPPDLSLNAIFTAFTYGYTLDSIINREKQTSNTTQPTATTADATPAISVEDTHPTAPTTRKPKKSLQEIIDETRER